MIQEVQKESSSNMTPPLQALAMMTILIIAIVRQITTHIKQIAKKTVQATENTIKKVSRNKIL